MGRSRDGAFMKVPVSHLGGEALAGDKRGVTVEIGHWKQDTGDREVKAGRQEPDQVERAWTQGEEVSKRTGAGKSERHRVPRSQGVPGRREEPAGTSATSWSRGLGCL